MTADPAPAGPGRLPVTPDTRRWDREAVELRHTGLKAVRDTAAAWEKAIAAVLGAFGVAAIIKGPEALKDIPGYQKTAIDLPWLGLTDLDAPRTVALLIFAGAVTLGVAIVLAALAAQGVPTWIEGMDGPRLRRLSGLAARGAARKLFWSRVLTVIAALLVVSSMAFAWYAQIVAAEGAGPTSQNAIVVTALGAVCGAITTADDGQIQMKIGEDDTPIASPLAVSLVEKCP